MLLNNSAPIPAWHRRLLNAAAIFIILLIAAGGVLCVTQSIRSCPDWPGCFGRLLPPLETSPILEITHRFLAASTGVLILAAAVTGVAQSRRMGWILYPPLIAVALLIEVSYFGARVVLVGLAPGWAAVDVGSALLAAGLIVTSAVMAQAGAPAGLHVRTSLARLGLATVAAVYVVLVSGVLVAGKNSLTGCLAWPLYSSAQFRLDVLGWGNLLRLLVSAAALGSLVALLVQIWRKWRGTPVFQAAVWVGAFFLLESLLQIALLFFGMKVGLLVSYTITMAFLWGTLVRLTVKILMISDF